MLTGVSHEKSVRDKLRRLGLPVVETWDLTDDPIDMAVGFSAQQHLASLASEFARRNSASSTSSSSLRAGISTSIRSPVCTSARGPPTKDSGATWSTQAPKRYQRGYGAIFAQQVTQADEGCDFALLRGTEATREPDIF